MVAQYAQKASVERDRPLAIGGKVCSIGGTETRERVIHVNDLRASAVFTRARWTDILPVM
jgi:hypothetical protein